MKSNFEEINSKLVVAGELRAYKISLVKWKRLGKKVTGGTYISIEKHDGRPCSLDKETTSWFKSQTLTINDTVVLEELIKELPNFIELLKNEQKKDNAEKIQRKIEDEEEYEILEIPHL